MIRTLVVSAVPPRDDLKSYSAIQDWKAEPSPYVIPPGVRRKGGEAICEWVRKRQVSDLLRSTRNTPDTRPPCASRSWAQDGKGVLKAVVQQQRADLDGALAESWRRRSFEQVAKAYAAAMRGEDAPLTYNI